MLRLCASTRGPMTPYGRFDGVVHSVFERVCNLKLNDATFLSFAREGVSNGPGVIICQTDHGFRFMKHLSADERFACRGNILRISQELQIDLRAAMPWKQRIASAAPGKLPKHWEKYLEYVGLSSAFGQVEETINGSDRFVETPIKLISELKPLIGKGPGLTPLGDDFIVGVAAGMEAYPESKGVLSGWLNTVYKKTTVLSGRALLYAAHGWFAEVVVDFLDNIFKSTVATKPPRLLSIGDTSGPAIAYGCLVGLQVGKNLPFDMGLAGHIYPSCQHALNASPVDHAV